MNPVYIILGARAIEKIKSSVFISGKPEKPEKTLFECTFIRNSAEHSQLTYFTTTAQNEYKKLYILDVLGLEYQDERDQNIIHQEFYNASQKL